MSALEVIALVVAVISVIKILVLLAKPVAWMKIVKPIYVIPALTMVVALILAAITLYYLLQSGITMVQIFAVMAFVFLLTCMTVAVYSRDFLPVANKLLKDRKFLKKAWLPILIWVALIILALGEIF